MKGQGAAAHPHRLGRASVQDPQRRFSFLAPRRCGHIARAKIPSLFPIGPQLRDATGIQTVYFMDSVAAEAGSLGIARPVAPDSGFGPIRNDKASKIPSPVVCAWPPTSSPTLASAKVAG